MEHNVGKNIEINWSLYKGKQDNRSKNAYIGLCELLHNNGHKLLSEYIKSSVKVKIDFNCGHKPHPVTPNKYKNGTRCPRCSGTSPEQAQEDFMALLHKNGHTLLSTYTKVKSEVLIDFNCGHEPYYTTYDIYKQSNKCRECTKESKRNKINEEVKKDFIKMVKENGHTLLSEYKKVKEYVLIDFNCGHTPKLITPDNYKNGKRCRECSRNCKKQAKEELVALVKSNKHKLLSEYINKETKVYIDFNCGHDPRWIYPGDYKQGRGCLKCVRLCPEQSKEEFIKLLKINNHTLLTKYINATDYVLIDFNCGHGPHPISPAKYKNGRRCPSCKHKGEKALHKLLIDMKLETEVQKKYEDLKDAKHLRYDFYLPQYNLLIELDGEFHRENIFITQTNMTEEERLEVKKIGEIRLMEAKKRDEMKNEYAKRNNIPLLRIEYNRSKIELDNWQKLIQDKINELEQVNIKRDIKLENQTYNFL